MTILQTVHGGLPFATLEKVPSVDLNKMLANDIAINASLESEITDRGTAVSAAATENERRRVLSLGRVWDKVGLTTGTALQGGKRPTIGTRIWVAGGKTTVAGENRVFHSADGKTWASAAVATSYWGQAVEANGVVIVMRDEGGNTIYRATVSATPTFATVTNPIGGTVPMHPPSFGNGVWVACNSGAGFDKPIFSTNNGATWTLSTNPCQEYKTRPVYGGGQWVILSVNGGNNYKYHSTDGDTWASTVSTQNWQYAEPTYANGVWIAAPAAGTTKTEILRSVDGITWTVQTAAVAGIFGKPCYHNGRWIISRGSGVASSVDNGLTWTDEAVSTIGLEIVSNGSVAVAGGYYSLTGLGWAASASLPADCLPAYGNGMWVAVASNTSAQSSVYISGAL